MSIIRRKTQTVRAGNLFIGGENPISIQSMTNFPIELVDETVSQIIALQTAGADLVRVAVRDIDSVEYLKKIIDRVNIPLSADIHFDYRIAIESMRAGISKIRLNPGNIGSRNRVEEVVNVAKDLGVPIRIGVNGGSLDKKYTKPTPENMAKSALEHVEILEDNNFSDIIVSIKASNVLDCISANEIFSQMRDYPLHIGLTEAGYGLNCTVQSSVALGTLLMNGIGDTMRVSMTGDPVDEIAVAKKILESVGHRHPSVRIISCPTCGRTDNSLDILSVAKDVEEAINEKYKTILSEKGRSLEVAVMGCEVNGPGEASHADMGIAGGKNGSFLLFARGKKIKLVSSDNVLSDILYEVEKIIEKY